MDPSVLSGIHFGMYTGSADPPMAWQLRAIAGPLEGAVYRLRRRVTLGRAGDCDIQIINDKVSRQHAKVVADGLGHVVVDLRSNNGTFIGEERVQRQVLSDGDELRIVRSRFVYERAPEHEDDFEVHSSGVWAVKVTNGRTLRQTVDQISIALPSAPKRGDTLEDVETRKPPRRPAKTPVARVVPRELERHPIAALRPDGSPFRGDLVGQILAFRQLQLRVTRGDSVSPVEHELLQTYEASFRQPPDDPSPYGSLRRFARFRCRFPARVRWLEGSTEQAAAVHVQDLGVGGARLTWREHPLREGLVAWLVIDVVSSRRPRTLVFPTRVAWATPTEVGLQFSGAVEWERRQG